MPLRRQYDFPRASDAFPRESLGDVLMQAEQIKTARSTRKHQGQILKLNTMSQIMDRTMQIAKDNDASAKAYFDGAIKIANKAGIDISPDDIKYIGRDKGDPDFGEMSSFELDLKNPQDIIKGEAKVGTTGTGRHKVWMDDRGNIAKAIAVGESAQEKYTKALTKQVGAKPPGITAGEKAMITVVGKLEDQIKETKKGLLKIKTDYAKANFMQRGRLDDIIGETEADIAFMEQRLVKIVKNLNEATRMKKTPKGAKGRRTVKASSIQTRAKQTGKTEAEMRKLMLQRAKEKGIDFEIIEDE